MCSHGYREGRTVAYTVRIEDATPVEQTHRGRVLPDPRAYIEFTLYVVAGKGDYWRLKTMWLRLRIVLLSTLG